MRTDGQALVGASAEGAETVRLHNKAVDLERRVEKLCGDVDEEFTHCVRGSSC